MIVKRLKKYIDFKGITVAAFERSIGMSNASFGKSLKLNGNIGSDKLETILTVYPDINTEWLLTGKGEMLKDDVMYPNKASDYRSTYTALGEGRPENRSSAAESRQIPLYDMDNGTEMISFRAGSARNEPSAHIMIPGIRKCDGGLYVRGDSVSPLLKSGDIVLYKLVNDLKYGILWGEMYLIAFSSGREEYLAIKRLQRSDREGYIRLVDYNEPQHYAEISLDMIRGLALIKASIRYHTMG